MQEEIIQQGVDLMLYGMGTVFTFLTLLVIITGIMSGLVTRFFPEAEKPVAPAPVPVGQVDARTLAVIKAAIEQHRKR
ncbi:hypothetical protein R50072_15600 [Simiduia litorea]|uniref:OadG family protein n=1 Tax=Simiduia litorea TaxID=1435348 RepID=UPI0036F430F6